MLNAIKGHEGSILDIPGIPQEIRDKYKEVFDIEPEWLIKAAAQRGKWIDQSQSLNLFAKGNSGKKISDMYLYGWAMGLKTTYYLRTLGATAIEKSTIELAKQNAMSTVVRQTEEQEVAKPELPAVPEPVVSMVAPLVAVEAMATATVAADVVVLDVSAMAAPIKLCKINDPDCEACQ